MAPRPRDMARRRGRGRVWYARATPWVAYDPHQGNVVDSGGAPRVMLERLGLFIPAHTTVQTLDCLSGHAA